MGNSWDFVGKIRHNNYYEELHKFAKSSFDEGFIWDKQEYLDENRDYIESCKEREIELMYSEFWEEGSSFHKLRREFVCKICPTETPTRLKLY